MATPETRADFVATIKAAIDKDGWDGVDLDWCAHFSFIRGMTTNHATQGVPWGSGGD